MVYINGKIFQKSRFCCYRLGLSFKLFKEMNTQEVFHSSVSPILVPVTKFRVKTVDTLEPVQWIGETRRWRDIHLTLILLLWIVSPNNISNLLTCMYFRNFVPGHTSFVSPFIVDYSVLCVIIRRFSLKTPSSNLSRRDPGIVWLGNSSEKGKRQVRRLWTLGLRPTTVNMII